MSVTGYYTRDILDLFCVQNSPVPINLLLLLFASRSEGFQLFLCLNISQTVKEQTVELSPAYRENRPTIRNALGREGGLIMKYATPPHPSLHKCDNSSLLIWLLLKRRKVSIEKFG